jgi:uncharacterized delta-60 repeat protein
VVTDVAGCCDAIDALIVQPDGKLVAGGRTGFGTNARFALARYDSSGVLDPSFGTDGVVVTDVGDAEAEIRALVLQPDGKLVAGGRARFGAPPRDPSRFVLARYNPDGTLDTTFGTGGLATTDLTGRGTRAHALVLLPDGRLVAAGFASTTGAQDTFDFALVRYDSNGARDPSFGTGGRVTTDFDGGWDEANALVVQSDGKLVAGGTAELQHVHRDFGLARYLATTPSRCTPAPRTGCRAPVKPMRATLAVRDTAPDIRDRLTWKWRAGEATGLADFGNPTTADDYTVCAYDESGTAPDLLVEATAPAGALCSGRPCWQARGTRGFIYRDPQGTWDGFQRVVLRPGDDGSAAISVKAAGTALPSLPGGMPLGLPWRVQFQATNGQCWEATYSPAGATRSDDERFNGKAD